MFGTVAQLHMARKSVHTMTMMFEDTRIEGLDGFVVKDNGFLNNQYTVTAYSHHFAHVKHYAKYQVFVHCASNDMHLQYIFLRKFIEHIYRQTSAFGKV